MSTVKHQEFKAAKQIALTIEAGNARRPRVNGMAAMFMGYKSTDGRMWVIADNVNDLPNPDAHINGKPAREIFGDYSIMYAR